jgi:hypothetical protein
VDHVIAQLAPPVHRGRRERRAERRRLARCDALSSRLAELDSARRLLSRAAEVIGVGWVQGAWFTVATEQGVRAVTAYDMHLVMERPVTGACLVGSVVQAAGGPATVRSQLVQRTLDLTWHTLREESDRRVDLTPSPPVRRMRLLDLTHWNDAADRTGAEVRGLLVAAQRTVDLQRDLCRADHAAVAATPAPVAGA